MPEQPGYSFDVVIAGAGPAGTSCALALANAGLKIALLDKASFPRDKICGDALSVDVVNQLPLLSVPLAEAFEQCATRLPSRGVSLIAPDLTRVDIPFIHKQETRSGYICARMDFDNLLLQHVKTHTNTTVLEGCVAQDVTQEKDHISLLTSTGTITAKLVAAADGAHSIIRKKLMPAKIDRSHHSAGLRIYYEGVRDLHPENYIELHFFNHILPGYFWIFPMTGNRANVGIGMLSSTISEKKINLKEVLEQLIRTHPTLRERFSQAHPLESVKGYDLPLGSRKRQLSGDRFLLLGDAAGLIDPFSGEGIGNAIRSGRVAADHIVQCFQQNDFSARFTKAYDRTIYQKMWKELKLSRSIQRLSRYPALFNYIMKKASRNRHWHQFLIHALADVEHKKQLIRPGFYYRLLSGQKDPTT